ncbi:MAG: MoaD/ThiS family protein [Chloroflexota bacterium]|nr:MoaD/ThiS family protein [Chloroflexota bacterium]
MAVKILIPSLLRKYSGDQEAVEVDGGTVRECIDILKGRYPELERWLYKNGKIATYVHIFVNKRKSCGEDAIKDGDEIKILMATGGG